MSVQESGISNMAFALNDHDFGQFQKLIYQLAGISLSPAKNALVSGRLTRRLIHHGLESFGDYFKLLTDAKNTDELQVAVDLLTTNETYFFREPRHFEFLRDKVLTAHKSGHNFRVWSAACSSGEEAYSIAMVLADCLGEAPWEVLDRARTGHYAMNRIEGISGEHLSRYCLKGINSQKDTLLVDKKLRSRVNFMQVNLNRSLPELGVFDLIFLRNVMIYFDQQTKRQIVQRMLPLLKHGGHFMIGQSESLNGIVDTLRPVAPAIYGKP
jgi:chemotaxis protein methyltransferase CheR